MSEKNIVRFKVNVLNEKFAKYIIDSKFSNEKYPNKNLSDFSFHVLNTMNYKINSH